MIFEVPIAEFDAAYEVLGGLPNPAKEQWFAIAAIKEVASNPPSPDARPEPKDKPARAKREWRDVSPAEQAGIRCSEAEFKAFLKEQRNQDWREVGASSAPVVDCVRLICGVESRADLNTIHSARVIWHQLNDQYEAWLRVGA